MTMTYFARNTQIDPDFHESALALIQEHGRHAYGYAMERAAQIGARGNGAVSRQWTALAAAIDHLAQPQH